MKCIRNVLKIEDNLLTKPSTRLHQKCEIVNDTSSNNNCCIGDIVLGARIVVNEILGNQDLVNDVHNSVGGIDIWGDHSGVATGCRVYHHVFAINCKGQLLLLQS